MFYIYYIFTHTFIYTHTHVAEEQEKKKIPAQESSLRTCSKLNMGLNVFLEPKSMEANASVLP